MERFCASLVNFFEQHLLFLFPAVIFMHIVEEFYISKSKDIFILLGFRMVYIIVDALFLFKNLYLKIKFSVNAYFHIV